MFAAGEGHLIGVAVEIFEVLKVFGTIVGFYFETFDGLPYQFLFVVGAFKVLVDDFFPFFGGNGRKFGE